MFDKICFFKWEYDKEHDEEMQRNGYNETYEICFTCKHRKECDIKNLEYLEKQF